MKPLPKGCGYGWGRVVAQLKDSFSSTSPRLAHFHQNPILVAPCLLRPSVPIKEKYRNINLFPIDDAFRPSLRTRLTLHGRT